MWQLDLAAHNSFACYIITDLFYSSFFTKLHSGATSHFMLIFKFIYNVSATVTYFHTEAHLNYWLNHMQDARFGYKIQITYT